MEKFEDAKAAEGGAIGIDERLRLSSPPSLLTRFASGSGLMNGSASRLRGIVLLREEMQTSSCRYSKSEGQVGTA